MTEMYSADNYDAIDTVGIYFLDLITQTYDIPTLAPKNHTNKHPFHKRVERSEWWHLEARYQYPELH
jgi:hypothetical protein